MEQTDNYEFQGVTGENDDVEAEIEDEVESGATMKNKIRTINLDKDDVINVVGLGPCVVNFKPHTDQILKTLNDDIEKLPTYFGNPQGKEMVYLSDIQSLLGVKDE